MAVLEIGIPTGFAADKKSVTQHPLLKRTEDGEDKIILYFVEVNRKSKKRAICYTPRTGFKICEGKLGTINIKVVTLVKMTIILGYISQAANSTNQILIGSRQFLLISQYYLSCLWNCFTLKPSHADIDFYMRLIQMCRAL